MRYTSESSIGLETIVVAAADQVISTKASDVLVLDLRAGVYHELNVTGQLVWDFIRHPRLVVEVCDTLLADFDATPQQVETDVIALLDTLASEGFIQILAGGVTEQNRNRTSTEPGLRSAA